MTPRNKAMQLLSNYHNIVSRGIEFVDKDFEKVYKEMAKDCALLAIDEILQCNAEGLKPNGYWMKVIEQIKKYEYNT